MKRVLGVCLMLIIAVGLFQMPVQAASETVRLSVVTDSTTVNPGDTVAFTVKLGTVDDLGGLTFTLDVPSGLTIVDSSISLPSGLETTLKSDETIATPTSGNSYMWSYSTGLNRYTGVSEVVILNFSCAVDSDATEGTKTVSISNIDAFDSTVDLNTHTVNVTSATITVAKPTVAVSSVSLNKSTLSLKDGENETLTATVLPADADTKTVKWSTSDASVATVANGVVTAVAAGNATITVTTDDGNKTATCQVTVTCNHSLTKTAAVSATCGADGNIEYYTCSKCSKKFSDAAGTTVVTNTVTPATGNHGATEVRDSVAATETSEGYTGDTYCTVCNQKIATGTTTSKLPHTHAMTKTAAVAAGCETAGNIEYYTCSKCSKKYSDAAGTVEVSTVTVAATGHSTADAWESDGSGHWKECSVCGTKLNQEAHDYKWVVDQVATEDAAGEKHEECKCGAKRSENTVIEKLDHAHMDITLHAAVPATCMAPGTVEYWTCGSSKCDGKYYSDSTCMLEIADIAEAINSENHVKDGTWTITESTHSRTCACGATVDVGSHSYSGDSDSTCDACGYKRFYIVISGANASYKEGSNQELTIRVDGDYSLFASLKVDNVVVASENYSTAEGSTIITFKAEYLSGLATGIHKIDVLYSDGKMATTNFTISEQPAEAPETTPEPTPEPAAPENISNGNGGNTEPASNPIPTIDPVSTPDPVVSSQPDESESDGGNAVGLISPKTGGDSPLFIIMTFLVLLGAGIFVFERKRGIRK